MGYHAGRHFLQLPGPTNTPLRVLAAVAQPTIDHRGPEFQALGREVLSGIKTVFQTTQPVIIYPASGTGAWEAALVNTLSPGDKVVVISGSPPGIPGGTNDLRVHTIGDAINAVAPVWVAGELPD